jgi:hypothetical protein
MSDNKNTTNLKEQGKENKRELIKEDEYYSKVNEINESISYFKRIQIFLSSYRNIVYAYLVISYLVPLLILFMTLFVEGASEAIIDWVNSISIFPHVASSEEIYNEIAIVLGWYLTYIDFGWLLDIVSLGYASITNQFMFFKDIFYNSMEMTLQQSNFFGLLSVTFTIFILNFSIWLTLSYLLIPKSLWKGKANEIEYYSDKLQKALSEASTLVDANMKKKAMADVEKYKKEIIEALKKEANNDGIIEDSTKLLQVLPAYKIAILNKDSIFGNMVAGFANKKWQVHVKQQTTIENFNELKIFLFESSFNDDQKEIVYNLNWKYPIKQIFPENEEGNQKLIEALKTDKQVVKKYKVAMMQTLMVLKYFKNYPLYAAIRFLAEEGIVFDKSQSIILTNAKKIIENQLNDPKKILDLSLDLTLPNIKDKNIKKELIREYSDFINANNKEMALLENEAETEVIWEPDTTFKIRLKEYKHKYIKILQNFIKIVFENYNMKQSENFEVNIQEVFDDFFENSEADAALVQIAKFKVIKLEDFYSMLDMVMKRETIYNKEIIPLYREYFQKLKIKEILYGQKGK